MRRRLFRTVQLIALLGTAAAGLSGCAVYPAVGYSYRSPGPYAAPGYYRPYRPYYGGGGGYGYYGRPYGYGGGYRGYYGRPYW